MYLLTMVSYVGILICLLFLIRNLLVYNERQRVLKIVSTLARQDIDNGKDWRARYDLFNNVSYWKMLFHFWKPIKSFYKDITITNNRG